MARAHFVKSARKDHAAGGIKKGDSYYWWAFMQGGRGGPKRYSKTPPKRSQLTQSEFFGRQYDIEEQIEALGDFDGGDLGDQRDGIAESIRELGEEQQEKYDNMPESLQQGTTGELLQSRADGCDEWAGELEGVDCDLEQGVGESDDDYEERVEAAVAELQECCYAGE